MPYKDKGKQRDATRRAVAKYRQGITSEGITSEKPVIPEASNPIDPSWQHVKGWLLADPGVGMPRLERLQRIAGSLGKYADDVWFGGLTMGDIGRVIGVKGALV